MRLACHLSNKTHFAAYVPSSGFEGVDEPPSTIQRICNVHIEFAVRPPIVGGARNDRDAGILDPEQHVRHGLINDSLLNFHGDTYDDLLVYGRERADATAKEQRPCVTKPTKQWSSQEFEPAVTDYPVDSLYEEAARVKQGFLNGVETVLSHRCLPIPIEPHPAVLAMGSDKVPFLSFSVYQERVVYESCPFLRGRRYETEKAAARVEEQANATELAGMPASDDGGAKLSGEENKLQASQALSVAASTMKAVDPTAPQYPGPETVELDLRYPVLEQVIHIISTQVHSSTKHPWYC